MSFLEYLGSLGVEQAFGHFLHLPSAENFIKVRNALIHSEVYEPYSYEISQACGYLEKGKVSKAKSVLTTAIGMNLVLSPSAHLTLSYVAEKEGCLEKMELEKDIAVACLEGILSTGDGSFEKPYLVCRTSDEYDIISYLEKSLKKQELIEIGGQRLDHFSCEDGCEIYFDITPAFLAMTA